MLVDDSGVLWWNFQKSGEDKQRKVRLVLSLFASRVVKKFSMVNKNFPFVGANIVICSSPLPHISHFNYW